MKTGLFFIALIVFASYGIYFFIFTGADRNADAELITQIDTQKIESVQTQKESVVAEKSATTDSLPLVMSREYYHPQYDPELVERARHLMSSGNESQKIRALHVLIEMSPEEGSRILHDLISNPNTSSAELVSHGLVGYAKSSEYLTNADLKNSFAIDNNNTQKIAAIILDDRGDNSLLMEYIDIKSREFENSVPEIRSQALQEIVSVGLNKAVPYAIKSLKDSDARIKMGALEILSQYGTNNDIGDIQPLLNDQNKEISQFAQRLTNELWNKSTYEPLPLTERLVQPGFPVSGLPLDLD